MAPLTWKILQHTFKLGAVIPIVQFKTVIINYSAFECSCFDLRAVLYARLPFIFYALSVLFVVFHVHLMQFLVIFSTLFYLFVFSHFASYLFSF